MKEKPSRGRPSKLTADCVTRLADALKAGHTRETAAALAGIGTSTFHNWVATASQPDASPEYVDFLAAVKAAEIAGEDELVGIIRAAAGRTWQAAAWILERRHSDRWGRKIKAELTAPPPPDGTSDAIKQSMAEAEAKANLTMEVTQWARKGIDFSEWPQHVQKAAMSAD